VSVTKRPHFVPRTYLRAWTDSDELLAYRRRGGTAIRNTVRNVAVAGGIYGTGELGEAREKLYQQVEEVWPDLRRDLLTQGDLQDDQRQLFALFTALQLMRTLGRYEQANFISNVAATTSERPIPREAVRAYLQTLDDAEPDDNEVEAGWTYILGAPGIPTPDMTHNVSVDVAVTQVAPRLQTMNWTIHTFDNPVLISNDCPVHTWRQPTAEEPTRGVGIETADEIRFPITPRALLVMKRGPRTPTPRRSTRNPRPINTEIARQCHQFVFGTPQSRAAIDRLPLADRGPRLRFHLGPGYARGPLGADEYIGEIVHMYVH
jgi:hypothetical protein